MTDGSPTDNTETAPETPSLRFEDMNLSKEVLDAVRDMGFVEPTPVQAAAFKPVQAKRDVAAQSQTGTGKTAAFCLPVADQIDTGRDVAQMLVLAPTRELAAQVAEEMGRIVVNLGVRILAIYGGTAFGPQIKGLKRGAHVVVGTPGRVLDHLRRGNLKLDAVRWFVLDEADEMLSMGFKEELDAITEYLPKSRQTLLFSATLPPEIRSLIDRYLNDPEQILLKGTTIAAEEVTHYYYITSHMRKAETLVKLLEYESPTSAIIFCNTRDDASFVTNLLKNKGFDAELISGELTQKQREKAMQRIKAGNLRFLVATDVAARGIDIEDLSHVINYSLPSSPEMYVHRTGRTGRAGNTGIAISIVSGLDISTLYQLTKWMKIRLEEQELPTEAQMAERRAERQVERLADASEEIELTEADRNAAQQLLDREDAVEVVATLLVQRRKAAKRERERLAAESRAERREARESRESREDRGRGRDRDRDRKRGRDKDRDSKRDRKSKDRDKDRDKKKRKRSPEDADTIVVHVGRGSKVSRKELREIIASTGLVDTKSVFDIRWRSGLAFVDVPNGTANPLIEALASKELEGKPVRAELPRSRDEKPSNDDA